MFYQKDSTLCLKLRFVFSKSLYAQQKPKCLGLKNPIQQ